LDEPNDATIQLLSVVHAGTLRRGIIAPLSDLVLNGRGAKFRALPRELCALQQATVRANDPADRQVEPFAVQADSGIVRALTATRNVVLIGVAPLLRCEFT
jgi:hypothetical protein